ncbi:MAG: menaquinone biosynthetic enzyme MqnA/MqnD family protein, partial [Flavobacteriales bacterium]
MRISAISYLNTQPFIYGIRHSGFLKDCELTLDHPAQCAEKLIAGDADVGIVPLAAIPDIPSGRIITDFCIACDGAVESVMIFSDVPMQNIRRVLLDYQSRTSVKLMQILASRHWHIAPEWKVGRQGFEKLIEGTTA